MLACCRHLLQGLCMNKHMHRQCQVLEHQEVKRESIVADALKAALKQPLYKRGAVIDGLASVHVPAAAVARALLHAWGLVDTANPQPDPAADPRSSLQAKTPAGGRSKSASPAKAGHSPAVPAPASPAPAPRVASHDEPAARPPSLPPAAAAAIDKANGASADMAGTAQSSRPPLALLSVWEGERRIYWVELVPPAPAVPTSGSLPDVLEPSASAAAVPVPASTDQPAPAAAGDTNAVEAAEGARGGSLSAFAAREKRQPAAAAPGVLGPGRPADAPATEAAAAIASAQDELGGGLVELNHMRASMAASTAVHRGQASLLTIAHAQPDVLLHGHKHAYLLYSNLAPVRARSCHERQFQT